MTNKKAITTYLLIAALITFAIGYALLSTDLKINGNARINDINWDVYFDNIQVKEGSTEGDATIENKTKLKFNANLKEPGDYYEFTVDVINDGSIDAMISSIEATGLTETQEEYLSYRITYEDGAEVTDKQVVEANSKEVYKVSLKYKKVEEIGNVAEYNEDGTLAIAFNYTQADTTAIPEKWSYFPSFYGNAYMMNLDITENTKGDITIPYKFTYDGKNYRTYGIYVASLYWKVYGLYQENIDTYRIFESPCAFGTGLQYLDKEYTKGNIRYVDYSNHWGEEGDTMIFEDGIKEIGPDTIILWKGSVIRFPKSIKIGGYKDCDNVSNNSVGSFFANNSGPSSSNNGGGLGGIIIDPDFSPTSRTQTYTGKIFVDKDNPYMYSSEDGNTLYEKGTNEIIWTSN